MTDSVKVLEAGRNKSAIETTIQDWLNNNNPTSIDFMEVYRRGRAKTLVVIMYTS